MDAESLNKLIQFLMALNDSYENIKGNILTMKPLQPLNKAFHLVQQLEKQKELPGELQSITEASALAVARNAARVGRKGNLRKRK